MQRHRRLYGLISGTILLALTLAALPLHARATTDPITIRIPDRVEVDTADVSLGQMAQITGSASDRIEHLKRMVLGRSPLAGQTRTLSRDYILLRLRQSGYDPAALSVRAPATITLTRRAVCISAADLEMMAREYVNANPPFTGSELTITAVRTPGDVMLPTGDIRHEIQYLPQTRPSGTLPLTVFFMTDGKPVKRVQVTVNVVMVKSVPVTRRPIARYQLIQEDDLMMQAMDVTRLPANTVMAYEEIKGQRARRNIGPRTVLRKDQLEFPPVVKKGDRVQILAQSGGLRITTLGEVKSVGRVGERVRVVNLDSNKSLFARVIDARTVQVDF